MLQTGIVIHMGAVRLVGCSTLLLFILYPQNHHTYTYNNHGRLPLVGLFTQSWLLKTLLKLCKIMTAQVKTNLFLVEAMTFVTQLKLIIKTSWNGVKNWKHIPISHVSLLRVTHFRRRLMWLTGRILFSLSQM